MKALPRSIPSAEGVDPQSIIDFLNACEKAKSEIHGVMIARHGKVIFEAYNAPYRADIRHIMHSFTKVLTNTAVSLAFTDGLLNLDDPISKFFPEYDGTEVDNEYYRACTIRNMITMRNGQQRSIGGNEWRPLKTSWKEAYFKVPFDKEPGMDYMYSSGNSYILSYIVQKLEGKTCRELVQERVGKKIGLSDFPWMLSPEGVCSGGNGVSLTTEDMLRIGLLYLNRGKWEGEQLISEEWIDYAFGYKDPIPPVNGVQYNFHWEHTGDLWCGGGMFGQTCGVIPAYDMVFAVTCADEKYLASELFQKYIVDRISDAEGTVTAKDVNPADADSWYADNTGGTSPYKMDGPVVTMDDILRQKGLRMTLQGKNVSVPHVQTKDSYVLTPEENKDGVTCVEICFTEDTVTYAMTDARGRHTVTAGLDHWIDGTTTMTGAYLHHQYEQEVTLISAQAYWCAENVLMMEWRYPEMAFFDHCMLTFEEGCVKVDRWVNMNSQDRSRPTLVCR
ncbi:MAG: serine hydrolase [Solobacterium sp.]|nr:serine hydrolase [Solobacterium sp.]